MDLLTTKEGAAMLRVSLPAAYRLAKRIPSYQFGRSVRFARADVEQYRERCRIVPSKRR